MFFLTLSNIEIDFISCHIHEKTYTTTMAFPIIWLINLIGKKEFAVISFDIEDEGFVIHIVSINLKSDVYPFWKA